MQTVPRVVTSTVKSAIKMCTDTEIVPPQCLRCLSSSPMILAQNTTGAFAHIVDVNVGFEECGEKDYGCVCLMVSVSPTSWVRVGGWQDDMIWK